MIEEKQDTANDEQTVKAETNSPEPTDQAENQLESEVAHTTESSPSIESGGEAENEAGGDAETTPADAKTTGQDKASGRASEEGSDSAGGDSDEEKTKNWYILKVQSNREDSICQALKRRVAMAGMDEYFDEVIVPKESVSEFKGGKKRVVQRKLYPGYILVHMVVNDDTWFLVRETPGIGDFTGSAGKPTPMLAHEVQRIVSTQEEAETESPKLRIGFSVGDRVKINEGTFDNFEGEVEAIDEANGRVTVIISIFGRSTPVELEYWQVESL